MILVSISAEPAHARLREPEAAGRAAGAERPDRIAPIAAAEQQGNTPALSTSFPGIDANAITSPPGTPHADTDAQRWVLVLDVRLDRSSGTGACSAPEGAENSYALVLALRVLATVTDVLGHSPTSSGC